MLPSTSVTCDAPQLAHKSTSAVVPECQTVAEPVVFRVIHLVGGGWRLEKTGGDVGGLFISKHAALSYACAEAEWCGASSVLIELRDQARLPPANVLV